MQSALKQYNDELHFVDQNPACTYDAFYFIMKSTEAKSMDLDDVKPGKDGKVSVAKIRSSLHQGWYRSQVCTDHCEQDGGYLRTNLQGQIFMS